jgi:hypothetical protein
VVPHLALRVLSPGKETACQLTILEREIGTPAFSDKAQRVSLKHDHHGMDFGERRELREERNL